MYFLGGPLSGSDERFLAGIQGAALRLVHASGRPFVGACARCRCLSKGALVTTSAEGCTPLTTLSGELSCHDIDQKK